MAEHVFHIFFPFFPYATTSQVISARAQLLRRKIQTAPSEFYSFLCVGSARTHQRSRSGRKKKRSERRIALIRFISEQKRRIILFRLSEILRLRCALIGAFGRPGARGTAHFIYREMNVCAVARTRPK